MSITVTITFNPPIDNIIEGIMSNFPEASGSGLQCIDWRYTGRKVDSWEFTFVDDEGKKHHLNYEDLKKAIPLMFTGKWPKGCTQPPVAGSVDAWPDMYKDGE